MTNYKITRKFGKFIFNEKTRAHKIRWYEVDEIIDESEFSRLSNVTQKYCKKISNKRKKTSNK